MKIEGDGSRSLGFRMKLLPQAIATGNIHIGTMHREVERRDAGDDAERLAHRPVVDAGRDLVGVVALEQLRDAAGELDDVDAARDLALRVGEDLAVLGGDHRGQRVAVLVEQLEEGVQDARAADRRRVGPGREGRLRRGHRGVDLGRAAERDLARDRAGGRVVDRLLRPLSPPARRPPM